VERIRSADETVYNDDACIHLRFCTQGPSDSVRLKSIKKKDHRTTAQLEDPHHEQALAAAKAAYAKIQQATDSKHNETVPSATHQSADPNRADRINQVLAAAKAAALPKKHQSTDAVTYETNTRFILYSALTTGQGAGNFLQGLLAAHLLGLEFNRTVCVKWDDFLEAFDYADPKRAEACQSLGNGKFAAVSLWNFGTVPDECHVVDTLSSDNRVVRMGGNTYPGWRTDIPPNLFHENFRAKSDLLNVLPYEVFNPPKIVVHFRSPDSTGDAERGLDDNSLRILGEMLQGNATYLVTNRPDFYRRFHDCCGWSYDTAWVDKPIQHPAMHLQWAVDGSKSKIGTAEKTAGKKEQNMKMWSDWYTMHNAETVYHSNSDFSRSAVHWNANTTGYQLHGVKRTLSQLGSYVLDLRHAPYDEVKSRIPPLVERIYPTNYSEDESCHTLRFCARFRGKTKPRYHKSNQANATTR